MEYVRTVTVLTTGKVDRSGGCLCKSRNDKYRLLGSGFTQELAQWKFERSIVFHKLNFSALNASDSRFDTKFIKVGLFVYCVLNVSRGITKHGIFL